MQRNQPIHTVIKTLFLSILLSCVAGLAAENDKDLGLHSDGGPWRFYPGKGDDALPRMLLIMAEAGIPVNDLYGLMSDKLQLGRGDKFHWNGEAYSLMAKQIESSILAATPKP